jgi:hypothetical protein
MERCSACKVAKYCSVECQRKDWKTHKNECFKPGQVEISNRASDVVLNNQAFSKILQCVHHNQITNKNIKKNLLLCLITPVFDNTNKIESYICVINVAPINSFSSDVKDNIVDNKRAIYVMYHDPTHNNANASKGSLVSFDFDYDKRDMICYERVRGLPLPAQYNVYEDGRIE